MNQGEGQEAWESKIFGQFSLHKLAYQTVREQFGLAAQVTVRCISKVADAYKLNKQTKRTFKPYGGIAYDDRVLNWRLKTQTVSIWTLDGRQSMPFVTSERQLALLKTQQGETDLAYIRGEFYLFAVCTIDEPEPTDVGDVLGVDLGIINIAVTSDGDVMSSRTINNVRFRHRRLRAKLQAKGTKSSRRRLKKLSGKERRFAKDVNHQISRCIVTKAQGTGCCIALEDLSGIRARIMARKPQRATLHSWSFHQLRVFIEYKAKLVGIPVTLVDPKNTSRTCPSCGCIDKYNRPSQEKFLCVRCRYSGLADHIAAENIRRVAIRQPYVSDAAPVGGSARDELPDLSGSI